MLEVEVNDDTDAQVSALGALVGAHEAYRGIPWDGISIVGDFAEGQRSMFGYVYLSDGSWEAKLPRDSSRSVMKALRRLHDSMSACDGRPWQQCLLQIHRNAEAATIEFAYEMPRRWVVSANDVDALAEALRPSPFRGR